MVTDGVRRRCETGAVFSLHGTKKLRDRVKQPVVAAVAEPTTWLGNWFGTVLFWRPQLALVVNEQTLFPVLMPLAPAASLLDRFPDALGQTLATIGVERRFIEAELAEMVEGRWAKTANRSVIGIMNEFSFLATESRRRRGDADPIEVALWLAQTPCGPLYQRHISPDRELAAAVASWSADHTG
jgi:hypothetical protein